VGFGLAVAALSTLAEAGNDLSHQDGDVLEPWCAPSHYGGCNHNRVEDVSRQIPALLPMGPVMPSGLLITTTCRAKGASGNAHNSALGLDRNDPRFQKLSQMV